MPRFTLESKSEKSAKPPPLGENVSLPELNRSVCDDLLTLGGCAGRGGAGRGGGCLLFFGGSAGLGLVGRAGGAPSLVGACKTAKGSQPNGSLSASTVESTLLRESPNASKGSDFGAEPGVNELPPNGSDENPLFDLEKAELNGSLSSKASAFLKVSLLKRSSPKPDDVFSGPFCLLLNGSSLSSPKPF
jgi:hypothetical protein